MRVRGEIAQRGSSRSSGLWTTTGDRDHNGGCTDAATLEWVVQRSGLGYWRHELQTNRFSCSDGLKAIVGLDPTDDLSSFEQLIAFVPPEERSVVEDVRQRILDGANEVEMVHRLVRRDGEVRWIMARGRVARCSEVGAVLAGILIDITEQKRAEAERERLIAELAAERARLRALVEHIPAAVIVADASGRVVLANPAVKNVFPLPPPEFPTTSRDLFDAWHARHTDGRPVEADDRPMSRALRGETVDGEDFAYLRADGTESWIRIASAPIRDGDRELAGAVVIAGSIDREKRAEEALRTSERRHRQLFDSPVIGIIYSTLDGRLNDANDTFLRTFGYTREDLAAGRLNWRELTPPEYREADDRGVEELVTTGSHHVYEKEYFRKDGSRVPIVLGGTLLGSPSTEIATFILDIGDRKRVEAERESLLRSLARQQEFERQLIGIVSHDLRTPLATILLASEMMARSDENPPRAQKNVERIKSAAERALRMVRDLLDFTRARLGVGISVERRPVDLGAIVRTSVDEIRVTHRGRSIVLASSGDCTGAFDADRMTQVVTNLVENAVKYSPDDSEVRITLESSGDDVRLTVHNGGPPIPASLLPRIFEPLQRGDSTSDPSSRSIGLGLYIVKHLVEAHGGRIAVESLESCGTTFVLVLPRSAIAANLPG